MRTKLLQNLDWPNRSWWGLGFRFEFGEAHGWMQSCGAAHVSMREDRKTLCFFGTTLTVLFHKEVVFFSHNKLTLAKFQHVYSVIAFDHFYLILCKRVIKLFIISNK
jgi:hypothetical protein